MKAEGSFSWKSPLMEIVSTEEKVSKSTEKPYVVVKARMSCRTLPRYRAYKTWSKKVYTMMCFHEVLFGLFEEGNHHIFEGELSFDWGNTWLKIMKLYDDKGNRLLRPTENTNVNKFHEKIAEAIGEDLETYFTAKIKENHEKNGTLLCDHVCEECLDYDCSDCPLY